MAVTVPVDRVERRVPAGASPLRTRSPMLSEQNEAYGGHLDDSFRCPAGRTARRQAAIVGGYLVGPKGPRRFDSFAGRSGSWCNGSTPVLQTGGGVRILSSPLRRSPVVDETPSPKEPTTPDGGLVSLSWPASCSVSSEEGSMV